MTIPLDIAFLAAAWPAAVLLLFALMALIADGLERLSRLERMIRRDRRHQIDRDTGNAVQGILIAVAISLAVWAILLWLILG